MLVRRGQIRGIGCVIKTTEAQVGQFLVGCKCPVSQVIVLQEQHPICDLPATRVFPTKCPSISPAEISNTPCWQSGPLEDNQWGGCRLDPKNSRRELLQGIFALGIFWGGMSRYAATPLIVALSPDHSDITRFRPWSLIATGNNLNRAEKIPKVAQTTDTVDVFDPHSGISGPTSWMMDPTRSREMPSCSAIDLAEIWRSSKITSWIYQ